MHLPAVMLVVAIFVCEVNNSMNPVGTTAKMPWPNIAFIQVCLKLVDFTVMNISLIFTIFHVQGLVQALLAVPSMYLAGQRFSLGLTILVYFIV